VELLVAVLDHGGVLDVVLHLEADVARLHDHLTELAQATLAPDSKQRLVKVGVVLFKVLLQLVALQLGLLLLVLEDFEVDTARARVRTDQHRIGLAERGRRQFDTRRLGGFLVAPLLGVTVARQRVAACVGQGGVRQRLFVEQTLRVVGLDYVGDGCFLDAVAAGALAAYVVEDAELDCARVGRADLALLVEDAGAVEVGQADDVRVVAGAGGC